MVYTFKWLELSSSGIRHNPRATRVDLSLPHLQTWMSLLPVNEFNNNFATMFDSELDV